MKKMRLSLTSQEYLHQIWGYRDCKMQKKYHSLTPMGIYEWYLRVSQIPTED
jgi:hypothetical protein